MKLHRALPQLLRRANVRGVSSDVAVDVDGFRYVKVSQDDRVGIIELARHKSLNALNRAMTDELNAAAASLDSDASVHAIVVSGSERAFAAGADVGELVSLSARAARRQDEGSWIDGIAGVRKPLIAAVSGFALGGGCELAMCADIVIADEDAVFGLPEVTLGTHPGWGGTQRLVRAVGKAKAMEMILTGRQMPAEEAESSGLVSRLAPKGKSRDEAMDVARVISKHSLPVLMAAKECVNVAAELGLQQGILFERRSYQSTFALDDQKEGMRAFIDSRKPAFQNK